MSSPCSYRSIHKMGDKTVSSVGSHVLAQLTQPMELHGVVVSGRPVAADALHILWTHDACPSLVDTRIPRTG